MFIYSTPPFYPFSFCSPFYQIDDKFRDLNSNYARLRREGSVSHPRVHIVKPGTFEDLKSYILMHTNASANQYKVPRKLRTYGMLEVMLNHV